MFELARLRLRRRALLRLATPPPVIDPATDALKPGTPVLGAHSALHDIDQKIDNLLNNKTLLEARLLDIDIPKTDDHDCWTAASTDFYSPMRLTQHGRAGLAGAITGVILAFKRK